MEWGEFATYWWSEKNTIEYPEYVSSVFITTLILHSLNFVEPSNLVKKIKTNAVKFLQENMENPGLWRFYGKDSKKGLPPDLDDSSCALAALIHNSIKVDEKLSDYFLQFRQKKTKLFYTWIGIPDKKNDIDCIVNSNVLFFFSLVNKADKIPEVIDYLNRQSSLLGKKPIASLWYFSPRAFTYMLTRARTDGNVPVLKRSDKVIQDFLCSTQKPDGSWGNALETALATVSLLNIGYSGSEVDRAIHFLLSKQDPDDGSWPMAAFYQALRGSFTNPPHDFFFGSEELTTAICLEALAKYIRLHR